MPKGGLLSVVLAAALLAVWPVAAPAQPSGPSPAAEALDELPMRLGPFRRFTPVFDLEARPGGAGLGAAVGFTHDGGERARGTVFLYDRGRADLTDGHDNPDVMEELRFATAEILSGAQSGRFQAAEWEAGMVWLADVPGRGMRCVTFRVVDRGGAPAGLGACVAVQRGQFVKVELTSWGTPEAAAAGVLAGQLLGEVMGARMPEDAPKPG
ncbi:MAG: hypothetical protein K2X11_17775 [Acetobacteraceae bacterium]|nr:hypothetical protein [Acetobacteraceae bacterium]